MVERRFSRPARPGGLSGPSCSPVMLCAPVVADRFVLLGRSSGLIRPYARRILGSTTHHGQAPHDLVLNFPAKCPTWTGDVIRWALHVDGAGRQFLNEDGTLRFMPAGMLGRHGHLCPDKIVYMV